MFPLLTNYYTTRFRALVRELTRCYRDSVPMETSKLCVLIINYKTGSIIFNYSIVKLRVGFLKYRYLKLDVNFRKTALTSTENLFGTVLQKAEILLIVTQTN